MKTNWREELANYVRRGNSNDAIFYVETLLEEVIEDAKAHFLDDYGMAEHLRAKWLTKDASLAGERREDGELKS